jgi:putrescine transport system ATP-binding protein
MMFQSYALFPHLSVRDNIAFGLQRARLPPADIDARVTEMVALVKLDGLEKRKPDQLSGGQRQRVALARSLARRPQLLLLDEPLAALDKKLRESTQLELMELQRRLGLTFIIVTHDQEEAMTMAGRIGVMDAGRLEQVATPRELYEAPRSRWIAEFVGDINLFEGTHDAAETGHLTMAPRLAIATRDAGTIYVAEPREKLTKASLCVAIRPEKVKLSRRAPASDDPRALNRLEGVVTDVSYLGGMTSYKVKLDAGAVVRSSMANTARLDLDAYSPSQRVVAWFSPEDCLVLEQ